MSRMGRPPVLDQLGITPADLARTYQKLESLQAVANHYGISKDTVKRYIDRSLVDIKRGRKHNHMVSPLRRLIMDNPDILTMLYSDREALFKEKGISTGYFRVVAADLKRQARTAVRTQVQKMILRNKAIRDVKGRYIPTAAVKYVLLGKFKWNKPIYARLVLKDGTKAKVPTLLKPTPADFTSIWRWDGRDQVPEPPTESASSPQSSDPSTQDPTPASPKTSSN